MALLSNQRTLQSLIKMTHAGVDIADFTEIRAAIIDRYKQVYGSDIDVSTATADGVFINDLALIINNILQSMKTMYANLDVNTATGVYLDNLCRLSNVVRKQATYSTATLILTTIERQEDLVDWYVYKNEIFYDQAGNEWIYEGPEMIFNTHEAMSVEIVVRCLTAGPVQAQPNWINASADEEWTIQQPSAAILGENEETDAQLRARRAQSINSYGSTVLDSLAGALLSLETVRDVRIYNNNAAENWDGDLTKDGAFIEAHSVYIILRRNIEIVLDKNDALNQESSTIANIIYQKMTPGIHISNGGGDVNGGNIISYNIPSDYSQEFDEIVSWKEATPIAPPIDIEIHATQYFDIQLMSQNIIHALVSYLNNLRLSEDITTNNIIAQLVAITPIVAGRPVFTISQTSGTEVTNPDTYFNYSETNSKIVATQDTYTIQLR